MHSWGGVVIMDLRDQVIERVFRTNYSTKYSSVNNTTRASLQAWANRFTRHCCAPSATIAITITWVQSTVNALLQTWKKNDDIKNDVVLLLLKLACKIHLLVSYLEFTLRKPLYSVRRPGRDKFERVLRNLLTLLSLIHLILHYIYIYIDDISYMYMVVTVST